ncbi:fatty acyl-CoA reductase wat isoform X1 [Drosophila willistoni]|uniref:fatty acyl-CoA reductase wat isoform X1 n=1 Tax=Drosophila willistoni TaxID=7260 RepID=UPI000C26C7D7|nr:fatty acyl-CoA reductase wat isoform X1 [Drosophila willistoni]
MSLSMPVGEFFENSEIFVTGGSGVVGKALIEKLLRSCNVRRIYVLMRTRHHLGAEERLQKMRKAHIFHVLRKERPEQLDKLVAISGDVSLPGLGLDQAAKELMSEVTFVYHCAATVRFDEPLRKALRLNVGGTLEAIKFAQTLKNLRMFMHVSTFFSNPYLERVEPKHYSSPMDWRTCLRLVDKIQDDDLLDALTRNVHSRIIVGFPNTYTFTKNLAESLINDYREQLPVVVYRPSIVLFAVNDPSPGFAPSLMGAMGLFSLVGTGILKTVYLGKNIHLDITPQDIGIKSMLCYTQSAYNSYHQSDPPKDLLVFQCSSRTHIPHTFTEMAEQMDNLSLWEAMPFQKSLLLPGCHYTDKRWLYQFLVFTKQILPALLVDMLLSLCGRKPVVLGIVRKAYLTLEVMKPFMFNNYLSPGTTNVKYLIDYNRGTDFEMGTYEYPVTNELMVVKCQDMLQSIRHDLLKEDPRTLERSKRILRFKLYFYQAIRLLLVYKVLKFLWIYYFT